MYFCNEAGVGDAAVQSKERWSLKQAIVRPGLWVDSVHSGSLDEPGEKQLGIWTVGDDRFGHFS